MPPRLLHFGNAASPVVVVDDCPADCAALVAAAAAMAPFDGVRGVYYPGLRRIFDEGDTAAWQCTADLLAASAPYIAGGFDCAGFTVVEASFSMVTTPPGQLSPVQRHPHFDSTDPDFVALIVYLFDAGAGDGTAFYRHAATEIEVVTPGNVDRFVAAVTAEAPALSGYFAPGDPGFALTGTITPRFGTMAIWRGNVLHSGLIPPSASMSPDPRRGRLTLNLFLQLRHAP